MKQYSLNGAWSCTFPDGRVEWVEVPGCFDKAADRWDVAEPVVYETTFTLAKTEPYARICFSGVSYYCDVYINGTPACSHEGMWDAFFADADSLLRTGENHVRVEVVKPGYAAGDRFPVRQVLSGFLPDVLCAFGGIWDDVQVETAAAFFVDSHYATGNCQGAFTIETQVDVRQGEMLLAGAEVLNASGAVVCKIPAQVFKVSAGKNRIRLSGQIEHPALWSLDSPHLYTYRLTFSAENQETAVERKFAFREITADKAAVLLNGRPVYLRGILHWGYYDDIMIPNPPESVIRDEISKIRAYGFNTIKHCLYIPRQRVLDLADEAGILSWVELPLWLAEPNAELESRIRREYPRILEALRGHPSVGLVSLGCELDLSIPGGLLSDMYALAKLSTGALVRDNSGSGECYDGLTVDYADFSDYHFYADLQNMEPLIETFTPGWRTRRPWVFGEFCDCDTLRDLQLVRRQKNVSVLPWERTDPHQNPVSQLKPDFHLGEYDARMDASGIRADFQDLYARSIDHAMAHRKVTLEQTRSFQEICGYNITCIRDVPITTSGLFDDMMEPKFSADKMRAVNEDVVLLPAWDLSRVWIGADRVRYRERYNFTGGSAYALHVLVSNYGRTAIRPGTLSWQLLSAGEAVLAGELPTQPEVPVGEVAEAGYIAFQLPAVNRPESFMLRVTLQAAGVQAVNEWPVFVYPQPQPPGGTFALCDPCNLFDSVRELLPAASVSVNDPIPAGTQVVITSLLTGTIREYMRNGGAVFLLQRGRGALPVVQVPFWRESLFKAFPHAITAGVQKSLWLDDLRYFSLSTDTAFDLDAMAAMDFDTILPMIRRYDCRRWTASDYMTSFRYGQGKCVAATLRLEGGMGKEPLSIQESPFGLYLLLESLRWLSGGSSA